MGIVGLGLDKRTFGSKVLILTALVVLTSVPLTLFAFLSLRFHLAHVPDAATVKYPNAAPDNPYAIPSMVMNYVSFLLPLVATIVLSARYFRTAEGGPGHRYVKALGLTATSVPLMGLQYLPWTVYQTIRTPEFLQYDDMGFLGVWIALYGIVLLLLSSSVNGLLWFTQSLHHASITAVPVPLDPSGVTAHLRPPSASNASTHQRD